MSPTPETVVKTTTKNLLTTGEGLFGTHVILEDVQKVIEEQMHTKAKLGPNTKTTVIGDGNGFLSKVVLFEPEWVGKEENDDLPEKFVLKIVSCLHIGAIAEKFKESGMAALDPEVKAAMWAHIENEAHEFHNREVNLYKITSGWGKNDATLSPKILFSTKFDEENKLKGFLGMEYVEDATVRHLYVNVKPEELYPVLKSIATLQANGLKITQEQIDSISGFDFAKLFRPIYSDERVAGLFTATKNINPTLLGEKCDKLSALGVKLINLGLAKSLNRVVGIEKDILVHGDLWAANILWKGNKAEKVIDYQLVHLGNPAEDLVRVFLSTLSGHDSENHWEELSEKFYEYFIEALEGQDVPYTLDQLKESYRRYYMLGGIGMLPMFVPIAKTKLEYGSEENIEECREILTEKAGNLLDGLERYYQYSLENPAPTFED